MGVRESLVMLWRGSCPSVLGVWGACLLGGMERGEHPSLARGSFFVRGAPEPPSSCKHPPLCLKPLGWQREERLCRVLWLSLAMRCGVGEGVEMAGGVLRGGLWAVCFEAQLLMCIFVSAGGVCRPPPCDRQTLELG